MDLGLLATAALLGVTHALEPDHLAGVVGLAGDVTPRRGAVVGGCFAVGHVALVVAWVVVATTLVESVPGSVAAVGEAALGVVLLVTAALVARDARETLTREGDHAHPRGLPARADGGADRVVAVGAVGALFTLSPPVTMLAFVTGLLPTVGPAMVWAVVGAYTAAIGTSMAAVGVVGSTTIGTLGGWNRSYAAGGKAVAALALAVLGVATLV